MEAVIPKRELKIPTTYIYITTFTIVPDTPDPVVVLHTAVQGGLGLSGVPHNNHSVVASSGKQVLFVWVEIQRPDVSLKNIQLLMSSMVAVCST